MRNDQQDIAPDASVFGFPKSLQRTMLGVSLFFLGIAIFAGVNWLIHPANDLLKSALPVVGFTLAAGLCLRSAQHLHYRIAVNSEGIWYARGNRPWTFLAWGEVKSVRADDVRQQLVLVGSGDDRRVRLDYQLGHFGQLREYVLAHAPVAASQSSEVGQIFHRTWINKIILLGLIALLILFASFHAYHGQLVLSFFTYAAALYLLILVLTRDPISVAISEESVVVHYLCRKQIIPFDTITGISVRDVSDRGNVWAAVRIERRKGKPLQLFRFREGSH